MTALARSALYVPGDVPEKLARAIDRGADELIVDLEDAVPHAGKDAARAAVAGWLASVTPGPCRLWVRVNPGEQGVVDIQAIGSAPALAGVVAAKTETLDDLERIDAVLTDVGSNASVVPLIESAAAVQRASQLAAGPRVRRLQLGEADLRADLGVTLGPGELELLHVRSAIVLASAAAGIAPPIGPVSTDFRDLEALRESTQALARLGFVGRACIHPAQLDVVHEVFTPTPDEIAAARELLAAFETAREAGSAIALDARGRMVDEAVARQARLVLARVH